MLVAQPQDTPGSFPFADQRPHRSCLLGVLLILGTGCLGTPAARAVGQGAGLPVGTWEAPRTGPLVVSLPRDGTYLVTLSERASDSSLSLTRDAPSSRLTCDPILDAFGEATILAAGGRGDRWEIEVRALSTSAGQPSQAVSVRDITASPEMTQRALNALMRACGTHAQIQRFDTDQAQTKSGPTGDRAALLVAADRSLEVAISASRAADDQDLLLHALLERGALAYVIEEDSRRAFPLFAEALAVADRSADLRRAAVARLYLGYCATELARGVRRTPQDQGIPAEALSRFEQARQFYRQSADYFLSISDAWARAVVLNAAALSEYYATEYEVAAAQYAEAATILGRLKSTSRLAMVLSNQALLQLDIGNQAAAAAGFSHARDLLDPLVDRRSYADRTQNYAVALLGARQYDEALAAFTTALELHRQLGNAIDSGRALQGLGQTYYAVGDAAQAEANFLGALALRPADRDPQGRASTLRALGTLAADSGDLGLALQRYDEALTLAPNGTVRRNTQLQRIDVLRRLGRRADARQALEGLRTADDLEDRPASARIALLAGRIAEDDGDAARAARDYGSALDASARLELPTETAEALRALARLDAGNGKWRVALARLREARRQLEFVRESIANPEFRAGFGVTQVDVARDEIRLVLQAMERQALTRPDAARLVVSIAESVRAKVLLERARIADSNDADDGAAYTRRNMLLDRYIDMQTQWASRIQRASPNDPKTRALATRLASLRAEIDTLAAGPARTSAAAPDAEDVPRDLRPKVPGTLLASYWLGSGADEPALALLIDQRGPDIVRLPSSATIGAEARRCATALDPITGSPAVADTCLARLSKLIVDPLSAHLRRNSRLVVVPDGALHSIPMAALHWPASPRTARIIDRMDVGYSPALRVALAQSARPQGGLRSRPVLAIVDPVFEPTDVRAPTLARSATSDGPGMASPVPNLPSLRTRPLNRLQASRFEADEAVRLSPGAPNLVLAGTDATRAAVLGIDLSRFGTVHIATHAEIYAATPQLSGLVLSRFDSAGRPAPNTMRIADIERLRLTSDLVFLSACDTAVGRQVAGEGIIGLGAAFMVAGARNVVASLWRVGDAATSRMVARFYRGYGAELDPVAALSEAIRAQRRADPATPLADWAAFIAIIGPDGSRARVSTPGSTAGSQDL